MIRIASLMSSGAMAMAIAAGALVPTSAARAADSGWVVAQRSFDRDRNSSGYGDSRRGDSSRDWAVGTFRGQNGANGADETITIRSDGSVELRTRDQPPKYGTFAGSTLTVGPRISRVEPARGGIVIDGAYYKR